MRYQPLDIEISTTWYRGVNHLMLRRYRPSNVKVSIIMPLSLPPTCWPIMYMRLSREVSFNVWLLRLFTLLLCLWVDLASYVIEICYVLIWPYILMKCIVGRFGFPRHQNVLWVDSSSHMFQNFTCAATHVRLHCYLCWEVCDINCYMKSDKI